VYAYKLAYPTNISGRSLEKGIDIEITVHYQFH